MKSLLSIALLTLFCSSTLLAQEKLVYSAHPEFAPMSWLTEDKTLKGLGPEIVETIFSELGIKTEQQIFPWQRVFETARQGKIDVIACLYFTENRDQFLTYSDIPYSQSRTVIITRKGHEFPFNQWEDLIGLEGGIVLGDSWGEQFDSYIAKHLNVSKVYNYKQNFLKLLNGRIDYVIATENNARILAAQFNLSQQLSVLPTPINTENDYVAFSSSSPFIKYLPQFNAKLKQMVQSGEVDRLKEKYIQMAIKDRINAIE